MAQYTTFWHTFFVPDPIESLAGKKIHESLIWCNPGEEPPEGYSELDYQQFRMRFRSLYGGEPDESVLASFVPKPAPPSPPVEYNPDGNFAYNPFCSALCAWKERGRTIYDTYDCDLLYWNKYNGYFLNIHRRDKEDVLSPLSPQEAKTWIEENFDSNDHEYKKFFKYQESRAEAMNRR